MRIYNKIADEGKSNAKFIFFMQINVRKTPLNQIKPVVNMLKNTHITVKNKTQPVAPRKYFFFGCIFPHMYIMKKISVYYTNAK